MSKQEAIELFNKGNLEESSDLFKQEILNSEDNNQSKDCLEYLVLIHNKINKEKLFDYQVQLLKLYANLECNEDVITLYEQMNSNEYFHKRIYLGSLWKIKDISKFDLLAQETCEEILTDKIYVHGREFFKWLKGIRKWPLYPRFASLLLNLDLGDEKEAFCEVIELEKVICSKWSKIEGKKKNQKEYLYHIYKILKEREVQSFEMIGYKKMIAIKIYLLGLKDREINKKELLSLFIINSKHPDELVYLIPLVRKEKIKLMIVNYIKSFSIKGLIEHESPFYEIMKYFTVKKNVNIVENKQDKYYPTSYNLENLKDDYDESIFDEYLKNEKQEDLERNELYFKGLVRHGSSETLKDKENLIVAFFELGLYDVSALLLQKMKKSSNSAYLQTEILYKEGKYTDVIAIVNEVLVDFELTESETIPFYYLKALAYQKLNKDIEAQNIFSLISTYDPKFRLLKERILRD